MTKKEGFLDRSSKENEFVDVDPNRCIGCRICELACSFEKGGKKSFNPENSRIRVLRLSPSLNVAMSCRLCENAPCVKTCPRQALRQSNKGTIMVSEDKCTGCGWCIKACPFGAISLDLANKVAAVCDKCEGRKGQEIWPGRKVVSQACIEWCPEEALSLSTKARVAQKARKDAVENLYELDE